MDKSDDGNHISTMKKEKRVSLFNGKTLYVELALLLIQMDDERYLYMGCESEQKG